MTLTLRDRAPGARFFGPTFALILALTSAGGAAAQDDADARAYRRAGCDFCHGPDGRGDGQGPALLPMTMDLAELRAIVRQGIGLMPGIEREIASDDDVAAIHTYLRRLGGSAGVTAGATGGAAGGAAPASAAPGAGAIALAIDRAAVTGDRKALEAARVELERVAASLTDPAAVRAARLGVAYAAWQLAVQHGGADPQASRALRDATDALRRAVPDTDAARVALLAGVSGFLASGSSGDVTEAERQLRRAEELFEKERGTPVPPGWGRADAAAWLGRVLQRRGDRQGARAAYERALGIEPDYAWVKKVLLPQVQ
jgi:cytochrome c553